MDPTLYRQLIGSLMYLVNSRLDLCFVVNTLGQFMVEPRRVHGVAAEHVLRYLAGTLDYGMDYRRSDGVILIDSHRFRLGRQCGRPEEHVPMLFHFGLNSSVVV